LSTADPAAALASLAKRVRAGDLEPSPATDAVGELVFSYLLWDAPASRARAAFKRVMDHCVDYNDLRVTRPEELAALFGKTYPRVAERSRRLLMTLEDIYRREHVVALDSAVEMSKRDGRKYVESLDAIPPFVAARVCLAALGAHAFPVDDALLERLRAEGALSESDDASAVSSSLERAVKAGEALALHDRVVVALEHAPKPRRAGSRKKTTSRAGGAKKTSSRRATKKTASRKTSKKTGKAAARKKGSSASSRRRGSGSG
jgi:endonuclease III